MKTIKNTSLLVAAAAAVGLALAGPGRSVSAKVIYSDNFSGSVKKTLDGVAPTVDHGSSSVWTAGEQNAPGNGKGRGAGWYANGVVAVNYNIGSAYLNFTPASGHIYTLSEGVDVTSKSSGSYAAQVGFLGVRSTATNLAKASDSGYAYASVSLPQPKGYGIILWSSSGKEVGAIKSVSGVNTVSVVLNTTEAKWTYQFIVNGTSAGPAKAFKTNPTIIAMGMGSTGGTLDATFSKFSLTDSVVPGAKAAPVKGHSNPSPAPKPAKKGA